MTHHNVFDFNPPPDRVIWNTNVSRHDALKDVMNERSRGIRYGHCIYQANYDRFFVIDKVFCVILIQCVNQSTTISDTRSLPDIWRCKNNVNVLRNYHPTVIHSWFIHEFFAIYQVVCTQLPHLGLGHQGGTFVLHVIIIIKLEALTFPIVIISFLAWPFVRWLNVLSYLLFRLDTKAGILFPLTTWSLWRA